MLAYTTSCHELLIALIPRCEKPWIVSNIVVHYTGEEQADTENLQKCRKVGSHLSCLVELLGLSRRLDGDNCSD